MSKWTLNSKKLATLCVGISILINIPAALSAPPSNDSSDQKLIEEITVNGSSSFIDLQVQMRKAEVNIYAIYNELNDNDMLDVICSYRAPTGTFIKKQVCEPQYYIDAIGAQSKGFLDGLNGSVGNIAPPAASVASYYNSQLEENIGLLLSENTDLLEAMLFYHDLSSTLEEKRSELFFSQ